MDEAGYARAWQEGRSSPAEQVIGQAIELLMTTGGPAPQERRPEAGDGAAAGLSARERQVIGLVAEGLSNQEIADRLFITERTVRFHITSIFNKLGADNRARAVAVAGRLGLL